MLKRLTRSSAFQALLSWLAANYIRFVYVTSRWREEGRAPANELMQSGRPYIAAFWHGRLLMAPTGWRSRAPLSVMISQHRDGEMIARTVHHFGVHTVRGSTTRGGSKALRELLVVVRNGRNVAITPDGRKVRATMHWVSAKHAMEAEVRLFDRLFMTPNPAKTSPARF